MSALLFLLTAVSLVLNLRAPFRFSLAFFCPLLMCLYGLGQALWSEQKIIFNGLEKSCFWLTAATIAFLATHAFQKRSLADDVRIAFAAFGSFEALLSLLEQASHTGNYFWLFPSGFPDIFGTFAYYNNFAQIIELTLPVTLWEGVRHREIRLPYLLLAALQVGAVVSSSSRAGAVLVLGELFVVLLAASLQRRNSVSLPVVALALTLSFGFTFVAGFHQVLQKLERPDQLANRRYLNESSLRMIQARPLTGWGLGAYVPVYKKFALYDDGTWVNQAHNDYLEWAAEGGIPYALVMVLLIGWTIRPAFRSVWGIGLVAFALHALVDYPFARLGTCGWYFALAGMLTAQQSSNNHERRHKRTDLREVAPAECPEIASLT
ncbi:MAG TPA: O-antigen ligase family protein [Bryobacteraceae bacterium]|nr:O-antigen ligase family protein [Bryobacteraceae bacterium]